MTTPSLSVSVVIPCRNGAAFLAATIASVSTQTCPPLEVIVVDDGSTDGSMEMARAYGPLVTVVANPGRGASAARNHGTAVSRGQFLQYLDADDLLEPHAIQSRVEALERTQADVAISDWLRIAERAGAWEVVKTESGALPRPEVAGDLQVLGAFWAPPAAILYRRHVVERIGGWRETLPVIQDARFLLDAARVGGRFVHVAGVGARYRQHAAGSLSTGNKVRFWRDVLTNAREVEALWQAANRLDADHRAALADVYAQCARVGFVEDRGLFDDSRADLRRFPDFTPARFVRAAIAADRVVGYRAARAVLTAIRG
jgi:hypothetical protein